VFVLNNKLDLNQETHFTINALNRLIKILKNSQNARQLMPQQNSIEHSAAVFLVACDPSMNELRVN
jgi:hypothetical protein